MLIVAGDYVRKNMEIGIVTGSVRKNSQSRRIGEIIIQDLNARHQGHKIHSFFLDALALPLWDEEKMKPDETWQDIWGPISQKLHACDALAIVCPEWAGMATPHLKNFFLCCNGGELSHKPCQLVSISAGIGGAYPVAELRMSSYKNTFMTWLPDHIIVRKCTSFMNGEPQDKMQQALMTRLQYALDLMVAYGEVMKPIRQTMVNPDYIHGM